MPSRYTRNNRKAESAPARVSDYDLVDDAVHAELDALRANCIARQYWLDDRSFHVGFARGEEIAWSSLEEFEQKRLEYLKQIQRKRRSKVGRVGERKNSRYSLFAMWPHVRLLLLFVVGLVALAVLIDNRFFLPQSEHRVWIPSDERAAAQASAAAATALGSSAVPVSVVSESEVSQPELIDLGAPAGDLPELRSAAIAEHNRLQALYFSRPRFALSRWLMMIAYGMLLLWFLRRLFRKKPEPMPKIPKVIKLDTLPD